MKIIIVAYFVLGSLLHLQSDEASSELSNPETRKTVQESRVISPRIWEPQKRRRVIPPKIDIKDKIEKGIPGTISAEEFAEYCKYDLNTISLYLLHDSVYVRQASWSAFFHELDKLSRGSQERQKFVAIFSKLILNDDQRISRHSTKKLKKLTAIDFNEEAKDNIEKAFDRDAHSLQMSHLILLAGIADVRSVIDKLDKYNFEIPDFMTNEEIEKQMQERIANIRQTRESMHTIREDAKRKKREMRNFHGYHSWLAELVKARDGNKESIEKVLKTIQLETDMVSKIIKTPNDLTYVYQPEIIPVLVDMLNSDEPAPYLGDDVLISPIRFSAAVTLAKIIKDSPISEVCNEEDLKLLRQWMSDKNNWVLKKK